jgi:hypothetical protein
MFKMRVEIHVDLLVKYPLLLSDFNEKFEYVGNYQNSSILNFTKIDSAILKKSHAYRLTASHCADYVRIFATLCCVLDKKDKMEKERSRTGRKKR